jgi:hypothetical protein
VYFDPKTNAFAIVEAAGIGLPFGKDPGAFLNVVTTINPFSVYLFFCGLLNIFIGVQLIYILILILKLIGKLN